MNEKALIKADDLFFSLPLWERQSPDLIVGMTGKQGGNSEGAFDSLNMGLHVNDDTEAVKKNREQLAKAIDFPVDSWVCAEQTHGNNIQWVTKADMGKGSMDYSDSIPDTDGLITREPGLLLTMCYADCVPLYFLHPKERLIGIAHAGWKGTVQNIAGLMVKEFIEYGVRPDEIKVAIGPSICADCYQVDDRVIDKVKKLLEDCDEKPYNLRYEGQYGLDLKRANYLTLLESGISSSNIVVSDLCTVCEQDEFFSHRRDNGKTGRMMSFIGWKE